MLVGAVVASTDAAAVFFLLHARGLRLRPRVAATLEVESGSNDPFAVFLTIVLVQFLLIGEQTWQQVALELAARRSSGRCSGWLGGRAIVFVLNQLGLPQGLHAPFVTTGALVIFGLHVGSARLGLPRGLSGRTDCRQPGDAGAQHRHRRFSTRSPGSPRS